MLRTGATRNRLPTLLAATLVFGGLVCHAAAQSADRNTAAASQKQTARQPAGTTATRPAVERARAPDGGSWTLDDALYNRRSAPPTSGATGTVTERAPLGRLPVNQGTFGIETESKFRDNQFSDGRTVPGLETQKRNEPGFFGLSLSVPTNDKSLIPVPLLPRPE
jgi:hypothetical protein